MSLIYKEYTRYWPNLTQMYRTSRAVVSRSWFLPRQKQPEEDTCKTCKRRMCNKCWLMGSEKCFTRLLAKVKGLAGHDVFLFNIDSQDLNFNTGVIMIQFLHSVSPQRRITQGCLWYLASTYSQMFFYVTSDYNIRSVMFFTVLIGLILKRRKSLSYLQMQAFFPHGGSSTAVRHSWQWFELRPLNSLERYICSIFTQKTPHI